MKQQKPYNIIPRYIAEDYLNKKLTRSELILCLWLRSIADIFGFTSTSVTALRDDMFPNVETNTVQKLLLSLRKKRYIHFRNHQGRRGTFRIESDEWLMKDKGFKSIAHHFTQNEVISKPLMTDEPMTKLGQNIEDENQKLDEQKRLLVKGFSVNKGYSVVTSHHNEHDTEQERKKDDTLENY